MWKALLPLLFLISSCGIQSSLEDLRSQLLAMFGQFAANTNRAMHLQILDGALMGMFAPENTAQLDPPTRMIPYAEIFTQEASEEEEIAAYGLLKRDAESGGIINLQQHHISLVAMALIAGLSSDERAKAILSDEIELDGPQKGAAISFGAMRYAFIRDGFLKPVVSDGYYNIGLLRTTAMHYTSAAYIVHLQYADELREDVGLPLDYHAKVYYQELKSLGEELAGVFSDLPKTSEVRQLLQKLNSL